MTPQDYTSLETALTKHAALETTLSASLTHNRDDVVAVLREDNAFTLGRENDTLRRRIKRLERRNRRLEQSNLELRCEIVFGTSWGLLRFLGVLLVVIGLLFGRASIKLFGSASITSFLRELSQPSQSWPHEFDTLEREYFGLGTPRKIKTCKRAKAYYARLSRTELMTNVSKTRIKCLKAELKKKGIETRGLLEDVEAPLPSMQEMLPVPEQPDGPAEPASTSAPPSGGGGGVGGGRARVMPVADGAAGSSSMPRSSAAGLRHGGVGFAGTSGAGGTDGA